MLAAVQAINGLLTYSSRGEQINEQNVRYILQLVRSGNADKIGELAGDALCVTAKGKPIKAKTIGQKRYVEAIRKNTVTLGIGPAGTGKTYLAVAAAGAAFRGGQVNRIILTRPRWRRGAAGLSARRPPVQGGPLSAAAVRRPVRHAGHRKTTPNTWSGATSRWPLWPTCAPDPGRLLYHPG